MKPRVLYPLIMLILTAFFISCSTQVKNQINVQMNFDVGGLYNMVAAREAGEAGDAGVEISLSLEVSLFVNGTQIKAQPVAFDRNQDVLPVLFEDIEIGSQVYAEAWLISRNTSDGTTSENIMMHGKSQSTIVQEENNLLEVSLEWTEEGNENNGGDDDEEGRYEQIEEKKFYPATITLTGCSNAFRDATGVEYIAKSIRIYAVNQQVPESIVSAVSATSTNTTSAYNSQTVMALYNLVHDKEITSLGSSNKDVEVTDDQKIIITENYKIADLGEDPVTLVAMVGFGSALYGGYSDCYLGYTSSLSLSTDKNDISINLSSMGGTPCVFEFYESEESSITNKPLLSAYTCGAVIPSPDATYVQYREVQQYAASSVDMLFAAGKNYNGYITGRWNGVFKIYQVAEGTLTNNVPGSLETDNHALEISCSTSTISINSPQNITFTASLPDGTPLSSAELEALADENKWNAILYYDGKNINDYKSGDGFEFYSVYGDSLSFNSKVFLEVAGTYQLYVSVEWQGVRSSQTFDITVTQ